MLLPKTKALCHEILLFKKYWTDGFSFIDSFLGDMSQIVCSFIHFLTFKAYFSPFDSICWNEISEVDSKDSPNTEAYLCEGALNNLSDWSDY